MRKNFFIILFFVIVFVPAVILSVFAVRAVNQEEVVQRRRLEDALLLELEQTNTIINLNLQQIIQELHDSIPLLDNASSGDPVRNLIDWKKSNPLVGVPYLLKQDGSIRYPEISDTKMSPEESDAANLFYWRYLNIFSNRESIPIYQNIASEYEKEILDEQQLSSKEITSSGDDDKGSPAGAGEKNAQLSAGTVSDKDSEELNSSAEKSMAPSPSLIPPSEKQSMRSKSAMSLFESDSAVQEKVYKKAEEEGQQYLTRNVLPQIALTPRKEKTQTVVRSVYIESTRYFEDIIKESDYGVIPRLFDSAFILLYWEKRDGIVAGCEIEMRELNERLKETIQTPSNSFRLINILDQGGIPLIPAADVNTDTNADASAGADTAGTAEKWRQPFVAKEISGILPYWETAILLRSPEEFQKQIESSRYLLSLFVALMCVLIFTGITAIYYFSSARLREVQQKTGFVTNVSHELKTPLTSIRMYSEMLSEGYQSDPDKIKKYSSYIASESQRLTRLINNVLDFAKFEKGTKILNPELTDINKIIEELLPSLKEEYEKIGFSITAPADTTPLTVMCDREAVLQVLINLFSNAVKYSKEIKHIEIQTGKIDRWASVKIIDRGTGIQKKYRKKIFREFFRIDNAITSETKGTGLGLSIARKIMRQHGGDLTFTPFNTDDYRAGSIFTLLFPSAENTGMGEKGKTR
ncbi:MAG: HAMP domain-containing sensor histidine kinase [Spirochaetia bacterium]|nr:HAMP domain-containing sensor histidine kinase [Spirochaetia bacterium]